MAKFDVDMLVREVERASDQVKERIAALVAETSSRIVADHQRFMPRGTKPHRPGQDPRRLADRVAVLRISDLRHVVVSNAPHLHLVELGTRGRAAVKRNGKRMASPAYRGAMPKLGPIFVPLGISRRADMLRMAEAVIGLDQVI